MHVDIIRDRTLSTNEGQFGRMLLDGSKICVTCEQPWNNNLKGASCIPEGSYQLLPFNSPAHGRTFVFHNPALNIYGAPKMIPTGVDGRSLCEIHPANWPYQLRGCVALGQAIKIMGEHGRGVTASVATFAMFLDKVGLGKGLTATVSSQ